MDQKNSDPIIAYTVFMNEPSELTAHLAELGVRMVTTHDWEGPNGTTKCDLVGRRSAVIGWLRKSEYIGPEPEDESQFEVLHPQACIWEDIPPAAKDTIEASREASENGDEGTELFFANGHSIHDPFSSECGRFDVNPVAHYGRPFCEWYASAMTTVRPGEFFEGQRVNLLTWAENGFSGPVVGRIYDIEGESLRLEAEDRRVYAHIDFVSPEWEVR